jgi:hypothetical protein
MSLNGYAYLVASAACWLVPAIFTRYYCLEDDYKLLQPIVIAMIYSAY